MILNFFHTTLTFPKTYLCNFSFKIPIDALVSSLQISIPKRLKKTHKPWITLIHKKTWHFSILNSILHSIFNNLDKLFYPWETSIHNGCAIKTQSLISKPKQYFVNQCIFKTLQDYHLESPYLHILASLHPLIFIIQYIIYELDIYISSPFLLEPSSK